MAEIRPCIGSVEFKILLGPAAFTKVGPFHSVCWAPGMPSPEGALGANGSFTASVLSPLGNQLSALYTECLWPSEEPGLLYWHLWTTTCLRLRALQRKALHSAVIE